MMLTFNSICITHKFVQHHPLFRFFVAVFTSGVTQYSSHESEVYLVFSRVDEETVETRTLCRVYYAG